MAVEAPVAYAPVPVEDHVPPAPDGTAPQPPVSRAWIYLLCVANFGISAAWALEFAVTTPYFAKTLRAGEVVSHGVWMAGPLSGLAVAPLVGALSDRSTSTWGRRRPFIVAGVAATLAGTAAFASAPQIAAYLFPHAAARAQAAAVAVAVAAFCITDLAINTTMWPLRALQGDLVPQAQQHEVQSAAVVMGSLGDLATNLLVDSMEEPVANVRLCFGIIMAVYTCTIMFLVIVGKEIPVKEDDPDVRKAQSQSSNIFEYFNGLPAWMWRVGGTYALGFFALFCVMPNISSWLGSSVLGGDPQAAKGSAAAKTYERGVNMYGTASLTRCLLQVAFSAVYPFALNYVTPGQLMGASFGIFAILTLVFAGTHSEQLAKMVVIAMALPQASHFTLPVGITVNNSDLSNRGRYLGALNIFAVIPQLIDTLYTGYVSRHFGEAWVLRIGGVWAIATTISALTIMYV